MCTPCQYVNKNVGITVQEASYLYPPYIGPQPAPKLINFPGPFLLRKVFLFTASVQDTVNKKYSLVP